MNKKIEEHPDWPIYLWKQYVQAGATLLGYLDWVEETLTVAARESQDGN